VVTREDRLLENQMLFRSANERLDERAQDYAPDEHRVPFLCECADDVCLGRVDLTRTEYQEVRSHPERYVILPGHRTIEGETVVVDNGGFQVAEKQT
jgi:hypothetical protein